MGGGSEAHQGQFYLILIIGLVKEMMSRLAQQKEHQHIVDYDPSGDRARLKEEYGGGLRG